jgi:hypothetical protein
MADLVCGKGINDSDYLVSPIKNGKQYRCKFYSTWKSMLERCYDEKYQERFSSYLGCSVCDEWLTFSKFKAWMEKQDWQGMVLDKDILTIGNKIYSAGNCVFIDANLNSFVTENKSNKGDYPVGVAFHKGNGLFISRCSNPLSSRRESLGYFVDANKAHQAWRKRKHELACQLADLQTDERVANALRTRYA